MTTDSAATPTVRNEALSIEISLAPAFHDCDPMHVVWHGHYFKYFEIARCALLQRHNYDYPQMSESGYVYPIVDARVKYIRSAHFAQPLRVLACIVEWENRLKIEYEIRDAASSEVLTRAHTIQVAVQMASGEMLYVCPQVLWDRLGVHSA